jgi:hypothetical protein
VACGKVLPMQPSPFRIHIKRSKKIATASGIADFLQKNDAIAPLLPTLQRNASLQKDCRMSLPAMFEACEVLALDAGQLTLSAPNAALSSKLRQQLPNLLAALQQRGWQINAIRLKLQVGKNIRPEPPEKTIAFSGRALQAFQHLEQNLENSRQNTELKAALQKLLERHRR